MCRLHRTLLGLILASFTPGAAIAQSATATPLALANTISQRYGDAHQYSFDGDLEISRKNGSEKPREVMFRAKVSFSNGPNEQYHLRVDRAGKPAYVLLSDGQKHWAYAPALKKYMERNTSVPSQYDPSAGLIVQSSEKVDLAEAFSHLVVPILASLAKTAELADLRGSLLTVLSKKDAMGHQNMTYLTLDTSTTDIKRMSWMNATPSGNGDKILLRFDLTFSNFRLGEAIQDVTSEFQPPTNAKRVESLPGIPGSGRSLR